MDLDIQALKMTVLINHGSTSTAQTPILTHPIQAPATFGQNCGTRLLVWGFRVEGQFCLRGMVPGVWVGDPKKTRERRVRDIVGA